MLIILKIKILKQFFPKKMLWVEMNVIERYSEQVQQTNPEGGFLEIIISKCC
jgi:hypothetical protein